MKALFRSFLRWLAAHVSWWKENYFLLPASILALSGSSYLVLALTGYRPRVDVEAISGWCSQAVGVAIVVSLAGLTQQFLYGYRSNGPSPSLGDDIHDSCVTSFLLLLFSVLVFGLLR